MKGGLTLILMFVLQINLHSQELKTYKIDSVSITAPKEYRSLIKEPYTEPFSLLPAISIVSKTAMLKQASHNVIDAMNYVPGGLTETRGR
jgi:hypothetical protein